jgi:hypothetical protein
MNEIRIIPDSSRIRGVESSGKVKINREKTLSWQFIGYVCSESHELFFRRPTESLPSH